MEISNTHTFKFITINNSVCISYSLGFLLKLLHFESHENYITLHTSNYNEMLLP